MKKVQLFLWYFVVVDQFSGFIYSTRWCDLQHMSFCSRKGLWYNTLHISQHEYRGIICHGYTDTLYITVQYSICHTINIVVQYMPCNGYCGTYICHTMNTVVQHACMPHWGHSCTLYIIQYIEYCGTVCHTINIKSVHHFSHFTSDFWTLLK